MPKYIHKHHVPESIKLWAAFFTIACLGFGTSFYCIKIALRELTALEVCTYRVSISVICLWALALLYKAPIRREVGAISKMAFSGTIGTFIPFILVAWAEHSVSSGVAGVLNSLIPIFTVILSAIFLPGNSLNSKLLFSVALGFVGILLIFSKKLGSAVTAHSLLPELAVIASSFCYAAQSVYIKIHFKKEHFISLGAVSSSAALLLMWVAMIITQPDIHFPTHIGTAAAVFWMGIVSTCFSQVLLYYLIRNWPPTQVALLAYVVPIVAVALGVIALGESIELATLMGTIVIIVAIAISGQKAKNKVS